MEPHAPRKEPPADAWTRHYIWHPSGRGGAAQSKRKLLALWATRNALNRLEARQHSAAALSLIHPKELDRRLGADAVHQGILLEASPLPQPRLDQISPGRYRGCPRSDHRPA